MSWRGVILCLREHAHHSLSVFFFYLCIVQELFEYSKHSVKNQSCWTWSVTFDALMQMCTQPSDTFHQFRTYSHAFRNNNKQLLGKEIRSFVYMCIVTFTGRSGLSKLGKVKVQCVYVQSSPVLLYTVYKGKWGSRDTGEKASKHRTLLNSFLYQAGSAHPRAVIKGRCVRRETHTNSIQGKTQTEAASTSLTRLFNNPAKNDSQQLSGLWLLMR